MSDKMGKGNLALDDVSKGVSYNKDQYPANDKFAVLTPTNEGQKRFFEINNYAHKNLDKEKQSPFVEHREKVPFLEGYDCNKPPSASASQRPESKDRVHVPRKSNLVLPESNHLEQAVNSINPPVMPLTARNQEKRASLSRNDTCPGQNRQSRTLVPKPYIKHLRGLYSPTRTALRDLFSETNPFQRSKYYNLLPVVHLAGDRTLDEVLKKSTETRLNLLATLRMQKNKNYLAKQLLPPVPRSRAELIIANASVNKNVAKRAANMAHSKVTNGGYSRTNYGGYYMH